MSLLPSILPLTHVPSPRAQAHRLITVEEEAAAHYLTYRSSLPPDAPPKPVVGYVAGRSAAQGKTYGHAGAVWWDEAEGAGAKGRVWREAGIRVARGLGDVVGLVQEAGAELERVQKQAQAGT